MGNNHCEGEYVSTPMQKECAVCGEPTRRVMGLPNFPLTDTYSFGDAQKRLTTGIDQEWRYCEKCGHGQLGEVVSPGILYGNSYYFRTSESATGRDGCDFFLSFLDRVAQGKTFNAVLDLGCNDLYLLKQLKSRTKRQIGVDPIWTGREEERDDKSIQVFGGNIETLDLISKLDCKPDLIVCRHTLEHIEKPQEVLKILMELASDDALFIFEVPGLDGLLQKIRFDQVFHQHLQYFSLSSFQRLLHVCGCHSIGHDQNYHKWSALAVAFRRGGQTENDTVVPIYDYDQVVQRYKLFFEQMRYTAQLLDLYKDQKIYGYGAAQMLPVLAYHLGTDFKELEAVLDDDPNKHGAGYWNLPVTISMSQEIPDLEDSTILLTALDNAAPIIRRLLNNRPKHLIIPLGQF